jgi:hypothetical protein
MPEGETFGWNRMGCADEAYKRGRTLFGMEAGACWIPRTEVSAETVAARSPAFLGSTDAQCGADGASHSMHLYNVSTGPTAMTPGTAPCCIM